MAAAPSPQGAAHPEVLATQVEEIHALDGIVHRFGLAKLDPTVSAMLPCALQRP
jgi:hypothetical protein